VNSLFYNLNEDTVEDLTGKGLEDLRQGVLRTPLPPQETFKDGEHPIKTWKHGASMVILMVFTLSDFMILR
jgi:hypothetical protein